MNDKYMPITTFPSCYEENERKFEKTKFILRAILLRPIILRLIISSWTIVGFTNPIVAITKIVINNFSVPRI